MSKRDWRLLFEDIIESINKIEKYTAGIEYDEFANNSMIFDAVIRNIEVVGEASNNIPAEIQENFPDIPWNKIKGIRNRIVHAYFGVDLQIIWFILQNELSKLKILIERGMKD